MRTLFRSKIHFWIFTERNTPLNKVVLSFLSLLRFGTDWHLTLTNVNRKCFEYFSHSLVNITFVTLNLNRVKCCGFFDTVRLYSITNIHTQRKIKGESGCFGTYSRAFFTSIKLYYVTFNVKKSLFRKSFSKHHYIMRDSLSLWPW